MWPLKYLNYIKEFHRTLCATQYSHIIRGSFLRLVCSRIESRLEQISCATLNAYPRLFQCSSWVLYCVWWCHHNHQRRTKTIQIVCAIRPLDLFYNTAYDQRLEFKLQFSRVYIQSMLHSDQPSVLPRKLQETTMCEAKSLNNKRRLPRELQFPTVVASLRNIAPSCTFLCKRNENECILQCKDWTTQEHYRNTQHYGLLTRSVDVRNVG